MPRLMTTFGLVLALALVALAAMLIGPLVLGFLFPWKPPQETGDRAILRVMAPPGEHYRVEWGGAWWEFWLEEGSFVGQVSEGRVVKDDRVKPTSDGEYEFTVTKVSSQEGGAYEETTPAWEGDLRVILYIGGEIATCDSVRDTPLELMWRKEDGMDGLAVRALCGRYRWVGLIPSYLPWIMVVVVTVLFLPVMSMLARQTEEERKRVEAEKRRKEEQLARQREEEERQRIESLLRQDAVRDEISHMSGLEFERFMADLFRRKGYAVQQTRATGDQGVDLLLDIDDKKVAVQLKRWTGPVGNAAVQATFAGMAHYRADEGWIITTSTFTKSARQLARSTRVRLIDEKELADWLEGLREQ